MELKKSIARRLLKVGLSFYFLIAAIITTGQLSFEYINEKDQTLESVKNVIQTIEGSLSTALWEFDEDLADRNIKSLIAKKFLTGILIYTDEEARYEVPEEALNITKPDAPPSDNTRMYHIDYTTEPQFGLRVIRSDNNVTVFDTMLPGMTFSKQFLQVWIQYLVLSWFWMRFVALTYNHG